MRRERLKIRKKKIPDLPAGTVAKSVERMRDKQRSQVRIQASVSILFVPSRSFFCGYPD